MFSHYLVNPIPVIYIILVWVEDYFKCEKSWPSYMADYYWSYLKWIESGMPCRFTED